MKLKAWRSVVVLVTTSVAIGVAGRASAQVDLGAVLPLTGSSASIGEDQRRGIELALGQINAKGGVLGQKLDVKIEDSGGTANTALDATRKLTSVDKVPVVMGEFSSGITIPIGQYLVKQGDVHVNIGSSSPAIAKIGSGSFSVIGLDNLSARFAARDVYALKLRKVAVIVPNNSYGQNIAEEFRKRFTELGGQVVASVLYTEGQSTYRRELQQMSRAAPDAYVYSAYGQEASIINREAYELGLNNKTWYGVYLSMCTSDTPAQIARGQVGLEVASLGTGGASYEAAYQAAYGSAPKSSFGSYAFDAVKLVAAAIQRAQSTDPARIRVAMVEVGKSYQGVTGDISFDAQGQRIDQPYEKVKFDQSVVAR
ncbi:amino acid ABC transporter substrate-binding protein [Burkholderia sp. WAC0059]|uniref:ABC transporter substrate-binding protein n=1 Tax=Burkholderia sp. WAC0059 TaxID=2066022 RepID=UPI000C7F24FB|nr:ABC transporter substrate-binding protein [Burkholderia sp. WAC0059]PLZ00133.1 amino acid ABC transporter substrate-binding protein [Burkholderia sp. WAC0059]